jgi:hypothetical protein
MAELNPDQFGGPNVDDYNNYDDYLTDKRRYTNAQKQGKTYVDHDLAKVKEVTKETERAAKGEYKVARKAQVQRTKTGMQGLRAVSKGLSAMGLKPQRKKRLF